MPFYFHSSVGISLSLFFQLSRSTYPWTRWNGRIRVNSPLFNNSKTSSRTFTHPAPPLPLELHPLPRQLPQPIVAKRPSSARRRPANRDTPLLCPHSPPPLPLPHRPCLPPSPRCWRPANSRLSASCSRFKRRRVIIRRPFSLLSISSSAGEKWPTISAFTIRVTTRSSQRRNGPRIRSLCIR